MARKKGRNAQGNGNRHAPKLGICPICNDFEIISYHHPFPRWIFGENDVQKKKMGRLCHDRAELATKKLEVALLKPHDIAFAILIKEFMRDGNVSDERIIQIAMKSYEKLLNRATRHWMLRKMRAKGVFPKTSRREMLREE